MAEVLPLPLQSSTITMLHTRPSSADAFQGSSQQYSQSPLLGQTPRSMYNGPTSPYKGHGSTPVQPYAFQATPQLRQETRNISAPPSSHGVIGGHRHAPSPSTSSSDTGSVPSSGKDDSVIGSRPGSAINLSSQLPDLSFTPFDTSSVKPTPDRYRRGGQKKTESSTSVNKVELPSPSSTSAAQQFQQPIQRQTSADDMSVKRSSSGELAKRYRRRSLNSMDSNSHINTETEHTAQRPTSTYGASGLTATSASSTIRPVSFHSNTGSDDSQSLRRNSSNNSLNKVDSRRASTHSQENIRPATAPRNTVVVPQRISSEASKRLGAPSPLSRQATEEQNSPVKPRTYAAVAGGTAAAPSPAARQLAALSDKDLNKGMKSRLRRAFSFGSAQELRKAAGENNQAASHAASQLRRPSQQQQGEEDVLDAEQLEIARRQEAAGIGAGIYSGQGGFAGSTDNLSISSTASSASMMLRKMGHGAKKGAKSIRGIFRPKSVIGVPAADKPVTQASAAQVSMVTVEAERQRVNVNADASDMAGGVTGFPKLERNSLDTAAHAAQLPDFRKSADSIESYSRRSVVGSDKERAEVLAAVKKGILKRSGTNSPNGSPSIRPIDAANSALHESPSSSRNASPNRSVKGLRTSSFNGDYFSQRMASMTKSVPNTPGMSRNISFSPRIQFHDAYSAGDYDRRGEIATCNRLTPMLAQQIKEELNTFKMEMEVHELSKPHTHFF